VRRRGIDAALNLVGSQAAGDFELLERFSIPPGVKGYAPGVLVGFSVVRIGLQGERKVLRCGGVVA
jgi:hypothetical protein